MFFLICQANLFCNSKITFGNPKCSHNPLFEKPWS